MFKYGISLILVLVLSSIDLYTLEKCFKVNVFKVIFNTFNTKYTHSNDKTIIKNRRAQSIASSLFINETFSNFVI